MRPTIALCAMVGLILWAERRPRWQRLFRWLPVPLWCYAAPMVAVHLGWLPPESASSPIYRGLTTLLLPIALALLLLPADLPGILRTSRRALLAAVIGGVGIVVGAPLGVWLLRADLPAEAWKGAGALAGTWTGGTMNLLALRSVLDAPDAVFAPLIIVDAVVAYGWMAILVGLSAHQRPINAWLRAQDLPRAPASPTEPAGRRAPNTRWLSSALLAVGLAWIAGVLARALPGTSLVSSSSGWAVLLVSTFALALSLAPAIRRAAADGPRLGAPCLCLVLAATGAQASLEALWSAPAWLLVGAVVVLVHAGLLLGAGRLWRLPLGVLATASQANLGGVVSAPLVGAVYHESLAPVGLLLAVGANALGTYLGIGAASVSRWLLGL